MRLIINISNFSCLMLNNILKWVIFTHLKVVDRGSETQLQVGDLNKIN